MVVTEVGTRRVDAPRRGRLTAPLMVLASGCSMYGGATVGVLLFDYLPPAGVAWLRVAASAVVLVVLIRPGRAAWSGRALVLAGLFGIVTALMNVCFYEAINHLPLGNAVAIEFLGPIAVIAYESRTARGFLALLLALSGVVLIADVQVAAHGIGVVFALAAAALWAGYILLGKVVAARPRPLDSLAVGSVIAALTTAPALFLIVGQWSHSSAVARVVLLALVLAVLSSVIPYGLDQFVLRMVGRARFALLLSLLPVAAVLVGLAVLAQVPSATEVVGIGLVVLAVAIQERTS
jgi:inner membrane transporter RhtA